MALGELLIGGTSYDSGSWPHSMGYVPNGRLYFRLESIMLHNFCKLLWLFKVISATFIAVNVLIRCRIGYLNSKQEAQEALLTHKHPPLILVILHSVMGVQIEYMNRGPLRSTLPLYTLAWHQSSYTKFALTEAHRRGIGCSSLVVSSRLWYKSRSTFLAHSTM